MKGDERIRLMDEIISGVQVIKMYAWEKPFSKLISNVRKLELKTVTKAAYVRALFMTFSLFTRRVSLYCALLTLSLTDQPLSASKVTNYNKIILFDHLCFQGFCVCNVFQHSISNNELVFCSWSG